MRDKVALPVPAPEARDASRALSARIAERIRQAGGWIGFDAYMAAALYEPGLGYYTGGSRKLGAAGDFVTAPQLSELFGACLARQCAQWFDDCAHRVIECGAGTGAMAVQVLAELDRLGFADTEYLIIEASGELAARQRERIARDLPQALPRVRWLEGWPTRIDGVLLANELLDALPVRAFLVAPSQTDGEPAVFERGVTLAADDAAAPAGGIAFDWALRPADAAFERTVRERLAQGGGATAEAHGVYVGEIGEQAEAWVTQTASRLDRGALLLIDYGFARREYYHPQRSMGTLMCHYRHHAHGDPFFWPGLQDITAHVDFTAIAQAAEGAGLQPLGLVAQSRLLTNLGLLDMLAQRMPDPRATADVAAQLAWARQTQAVQVLLSEAEMGELFKALALVRDARHPAIGFSRGLRELMP